MTTEPAKSRARGSKAPTGELRGKPGAWQARIRIEGKTREAFALTACPREEDARERCALMASLAARLRAAGHTVDASKLLRLAAAARTGGPLQAILDAVETICAGEATRASNVDAVTFEAFADEWTSGRLHKRFPDHVPTKDAYEDKAMLRRYIVPQLTGVAIVDVTLDDCDRVMAALPNHLSAASRRHVGQVVRRVLSLAVYPAKLLTTSPIPRGWLPKLRGAKAFTYIYPEEDLALLRCQAIPLLRRLFYGVLAREGMRREELAALRFGDLELARGLIRLDENKTNDPRSWALDPGVAEALRRWKAHHRRGAIDADPVFADANGVALFVQHLASELRDDLALAGVTRPTLFERSDVRRPIRIHDLRSSFVTVSLANGKSETWVADRTGHRSSEMINRYRRAARTWAETAIGTFAPLVEALPDLEGGSLPPVLPPSGTTVQSQNEAKSSGEKGIRTPGTLASSPDFESESDLSDLAGKGNYRETGDPRSHDETRPATAPGQAGGDDSSPRASAAVALVRHAVRLAAAGDTAGARALHAAIGAILEASAPSTAGTGEADAVVVDLVGALAARGKR